MGKEIDVNLIFNSQNFAFSMMFFSSFKAPLDYSVFTEAACSFLLYKNSK